MNLLKKHVALPGDHGSWVFLFSPLLIGLWAGGRLTTVSWYLVAASLCGFLSRQPITILVQVASGRRGRLRRGRQSHRRRLRVLRRPGHGRLIQRPELKVILDALDALNQPVEVSPQFLIAHSRASGRG